MVAPIRQRIVKRGEHSGKLEGERMEEVNEEELWDVNLRRKIRSDQRKTINDVHSK